MTTGGWIFMLVSVAFVAVLNAFCFYRVLTTPSPTDEEPALGDGDPRTPE